MCSAGRVRGSEVLGHGLHRPGSQESCVMPLKQGSYVAFHCFSLLSCKMSTRHFGRCPAANRKYETKIGWNQYEKQVRVGYRVELNEPKTFRVRSEVRYIA